MNQRQSQKNPPTGSDAPDAASSGFIGLGMMGMPMAANFLGAGHGVLGFDALADAAAELRTHARFTWAGSALDLASAAIFAISSRGVGTSAAGRAPGAVARAGLGLR